MCRQGIIKLLGNLVQLGQSSPGDRREVVVLIVQTDIVSEKVQDAVVAVGLRKRDLVLGVSGFVRNVLIHVVFGDEMPCCWVETASQEGGQDQVQDRVDREVVREQGNEGVVEGQLNGNVEPVDPGEGDTVNGHRAEGVE